MSASFVKALYQCRLQKIARALIQTANDEQVKYAYEFFTKQIEEQQSHIGDYDFLTNNFQKMQTDIKMLEMLVREANKRKLYHSVTTTVTTTTKTKKKK
ncbi:MAG: hypothetical protein QM703_22870 [Gemmatales bacterium]